MDSWHLITKEKPSFKCLFTLEEVDSTPWAEKIAEYAAVDKVYKINNPMLTNVCQMHIAMMKEANELDDINTTTCYYGSNVEMAVTICQEGLHTNYLADNIHRADWEVSGFNTRAMFQCNVALGNVHQYDPEDNSLCPPGYDSTVNIDFTGYNIVINDRYQACVEYIILYKPNNGMTHSPNLQIVDGPDIVYIPSSIKVFFNDMVNRAADISPEAEIVMKINISRMLKHRRTPEDFLLMANHILGVPVPQGLLENIKHVLEKCSKWLRGGASPLP